MRGGGDIKNKKTVTLANMEREKGNKDKQTQGLRNTKETNTGVRYNEKPREGCGIYKTTTTTHPNKTTITNHT